MNKIYSMLPRLLLVAPMLAILGGCKSTGGARLDTASPASSPPPSALPRISIDTTAATELGQAIRQIGETAGGGTVLVAGMEGLRAAPLQLQDANYVSGLKQLLANVESKIQVTPYYAFLYPPGYEVLEGHALSGTLHPRFEALSASFAVGAGTDFYNALALLGDALGVTIVADNSLADAWCGELFLENAPLPVILEALLKSALVLPDSVRVESTETYVFIRAATNLNRSSALINPGDADGTLQERLKTPVTLRLPKSAEGIVFESGYTPLAQVLPSLSAQLGISATTEPAMADFPVYVAEFNDTPMETVLDLIVWQWLPPEFGYRVTEDGIRFCARPG